MKKIYIHGSFMNDNYGDFLLYYVVEKIIEKYEDSLSWFSADVDKSYDKYCKVNRKTKKEAVSSADLVIFAGGGYFGEPAKRKLFWNVRCLLKHVLPAYRIYKRKVPYIIVGVEVGPISFLPNRILLKKIFDSAKRISVRNIESKEFLEKNHVCNKIEVNADWIMGISKDSLLHKNINLDDLLTRKGHEKYMFVHLTTRNDNDGMNNVVNDLKKFQEENDVVYIIGCDQDRDTQKERVKILYNALGNKKNKICFYRGPWYLSEILNNVDAVITDKLHVSIVSTKFNKEVISVACHPKTIRFFSLIGRSEWASLITNVKPGETYGKLKCLKFKPVTLDNPIFVEAENNQKIVIGFLEKYSEKEKRYER